MASADDPRSLPPRGRLLAPPVAICTGKVALLDWAAAGRKEPLFRRESGKPWTDIEIRNRMMKRHTSFAAAAVAALALAGASPATAQSTFQNFICADGSRFTAAFLTQDPKQAHLQIDGKAVTLRKRFTLSGARYTGRGVTLTMTKKGTFLRHGKRGVTGCSAA